MKRFSLVLAFVAAPLMAAARPADCLFVIDGKTITDGPCDFAPEKYRSSGDPKGSFSVQLPGGYFAIVSLITPTEASASWSGEPWVSHAHDDLGQLTKAGACWQNSAVKLCAWNPSKQSAASRISPRQLIGTVADKYCQRLASKNIDFRFDKKLYQNCLAEIANTIRK